MFNIQTNMQKQLTLVNFQQHLYKNQMLTATKNQKAIDTFKYKHYTVVTSVKYFIKCFQLFSHAMIILQNNFLLLKLLTKKYKYFNGLYNMIYSTN